MSDRRWGSVPYLDAIRPEPGWQTDYAFLASYSADLVALAAALLALAGLDDDRGSGSKVDFANAVESLKDRVRLVVQVGRLVAPARTPKILAILDRYVREVPSDEAAASWHPKFALARLSTEDGKATQWRLWLGSRNLTRDVSWDVGLTLVGRPAGPGDEVDGVANLGAAIAARGGLPGVSPAKVRVELRSVRWAAPRGCKVRSVRLLDGGTGRDVPATPPGLRKLIVVSPFLDGGVVKRLSLWGEANTRRLLVSTRPELNKLAQQAGKPLAGFSELLYLDAPDPEGRGMGDDPNPEKNGTSDEEPEARGLHAKIIYAEHAGGRTLWVGSANATQRGWQGPNAEVVAEMSVTAEVGAGLESFVTDLARTVRADELTEPEDHDEVEDRLEDARKQVASRWCVVQREGAVGPLLSCSVPPHPDDTAIELHVAPLGGAAVPWPRGVNPLQLPPVPPGELSELVCCRLRLAAADTAWLQRAPLEPPPGDDRDRRAIARYLDPRTFLMWIRSLLTGGPVGEGGGDWDEERAVSAGDAPRHAGPAWWAPTVEDVLKAWDRDPGSLAAVDRKVGHYLKLYEEQDTQYTDEERRAVEEFQRTWLVLRRELVQGQQ